MTYNQRILTRRELFDLVWSKPMQKLAEEFGLSDRGLGKICSRHRVPSPPRGYWARIAAGQKVKTPLFHEVADPSLNYITIFSSLSNLPEETREILREVKKSRAARLQDPSPQLPLPSDVIEKPHRVVALTAKVLRKAKPNAYGGVSAAASGMGEMGVHADRVERLIEFLHRLATALEAAGLNLELNGPRMQVVVGSDKVLFMVNERTRRQTHDPTEAEQSLYERQQVKRQRAADRKNWDLYRSLPWEKPWPEYDTIYTGQLFFQIDGWGNGLRRTWSDGKTQSVESMFEDIVAGIKISLVHEKADRERREEDARQHAEFARLQRLAEKRAERESERVDYLHELMALRREAAEISGWLASLPREVLGDRSTELGRMLLWAQRRMAKLDAQTTVEAAAARLDGKSLFPEIDDLRDPLKQRRTVPALPWASPSHRHRRYRIMR